MPEEKKSFRTHLLIYPKFQLGLIGAVLGIITLAIVFIGYKLQASIESVRQMAIQAKLPPEHAYFQFLDWQEQKMFLYFWITFGVAFILASLIALALSNKLAGPIVRLRAYFDSISKDGYTGTQIQFRKGDFFSDLPKRINGALNKIVNSPNS